MTAIKIFVNTIELQIHGLLTTEQALARLNSSGRLRRPATPANWCFVTRSRGIKPATMMGRFNLWTPEAVDKALEAFVNIEQSKLSIVRRNIRRDLDDECL